MTHTAHLVIDKQIYAIAGISDKEANWLAIFAKQVASQLFIDNPIIPNKDSTHMGVFTYDEFRRFIKEVGYISIVNITDEIFCNQ